MPLSEGVYSGRVRHRRTFDVTHEFVYPVWMSLFDVSTSRLPWLLRGRKQRYLQRDEVLARLGLETGAARVLCLTQPSLVGRSFNPVSFYFAATGDDLQGIVAHITNTPWGEDHVYALTPNEDLHWSFDKAFHVSPFLPMDLRYLWRFDVGSEKVNVGMRLCRGEATVFTASLALKARRASMLSALSLRLRYPFQNLVTHLRIYWQAARLRSKGAHFYAHPSS